MIQLFKTKRLDGGLYLILLFFICRLAVVMNGIVNSGMPSAFDLKYSWLSIIVTSILLFGCGELISNIVNRYQFLEKPTNLATAIFYILSNFIPRSHSIGLWCFVLVFLILIMNKLTKTYQKSRPESNFFDASFLIGICSIIYPEYSILVLVIMFCTILVTQFRLHYITIVIVAFIMPWVYWFSYLYFTHNLNWFQDTLDTWQQTAIWNYASFDYEMFLPSIYILGSFSILALVFWLNRMPYLEGYQRPILQISTLFIVFSLLILAIFPLSQQHLMLLFTTFAVFVLSFWFFYANKFLANLLFIILITIAILYPFVKNINFSL